MAWNGTVLDFGGTFADGNRIDELSRQPAWRGATFRIAHAPPGPRLWATGAIPPLNAKTWWIALLVLASSRAISLAHWPAFQRAQSSTLFSRDNPGRRVLAMSTSSSAN